MKEVDHNGYWYISDNPISKAGVFPYLGSQISGELEPDKIYHVLRPEKELFSQQTIDSFKLVPLVDEHEMLGKDFTPPEEKGVHGTLGEKVYAKDGTLYADMKIFSEALKDEIQGGKKDLSLGYRCDYDLTDGIWNGQRYDAVQRNIRGNHVALVQEGRMGKDVRVMDARSITFDSIEEIKQMEQEKREDWTARTADERVDKRDIIRQIMAVAAKPQSDFNGGEEERERTIAQLAEKLAYNDSERSGDDQKPEWEKRAQDADIDKRKQIDEIGGILKGKIPEELWRTVMGKVEKVGYNDSERGANDACTRDEEKEEAVEIKKIKESMDSLPEKLLSMMAEREALYAKLSPIIGTFDHAVMTTQKMAKYACDKLSLNAGENEALPVLKGYLAAYKPAQGTVVMDEGVVGAAHGEDRAFNEYLGKGDK